MPIHVTDSNGGCPSLLMWVFAFSLVVFGAVINSEGAETNYHPVAEKCLSKVQELNTMIQKSLSGYV